MLNSEKVQSRVSRIPIKMRNFSYEERLLVWGYQSRNALEEIDWFTGL